ncbi:MAG: hypothetical protein WA997_17775 [Anaerolineales bacterium]|nr:hypothetical protein [Anaerolineales bacterium]
MKNFRNYPEPEIYEIRIQGHLQDRWAEWFYGLTLTREDNGSTTLYGPLPDQTALHSVLQKISSMNLRLISVSEKIQEPEDEK